MDEKTQAEIAEIQEAVTDLTNATPDLIEMVVLLKSQLTATHVALGCVIHSLPASSRRKFEKNIGKVLSNKLAPRDWSDSDRKYFIELVGLEKKQSILQRIFGF